MSTTVEKVTRIINEIEGKKNATKKSIDEVMDILLSGSMGNHVHHDIAEKKEKSEENGMGFYLDMDELGIWRERNNHLYRLEYYRPLTTHRRRFRKIIIFGKRLIRKLIAFIAVPTLESQNAFNGSVTASINAIYNNDIVLQNFMDTVVGKMDLISMKQDSAASRLDEIEKRISELQSNNEARIDELEKNLSTLQRDNATRINEVERYQGEIQNKNEESLVSLQISIKEALAADDQIRHSLHELTNSIDEIHRYQDTSELQILRAIEDIGKENQRGDDTRILVANTTTIDSKQNKPSGNTYDVIDYFNFENHFRGSRADIKTSQMMYLPYFQDKEQIIDLGCGRGEFLELLSQHSIRCIGVELYKEFVDYCHLKGLTVVHGDAISYLSSLNNESIGGLFASQLVEHLETAQLVELCMKAYEKLQQGSFFVLETPNPTCLATYTNAFYIDPSHTKPVHPLTLEYLLRQAGFKRIEIQYTEHSKLDYRLPLLNSEHISDLAQFNDGMNYLSDILFGSMDYAIIAEK